MPRARTIATEGTGVILVAGADPKGRGTHLAFTSVSVDRPPELTSILVSNVDDRGVRFAVGALGMRSTTWALFGRRNKNDVYLGSRKSAGETKVSFHESGDWRYQSVGKPIKDLVDVRLIGTRTQEEMDGRIIMKWPRPDMVNGWLKAAVITVPHRDISPIPGDDSPEGKIYWFDAPQPRWIVDIEIVYLADGEGTLRLLHDGHSGDLKLGGGFRLPNGETVLVLAYYWPENPGQEAHFRKYRREQRSELARTSAFELTPSLGPRTALFGIDDGGTLVVVDLSLYDGATAFRRRPDPDLFCPNALASGRSSSRVSARVRLGRVLGGCHRDVELPTSRILDE